MSSTGVREMNLCLSRPIRKCDTARKMIYYSPSTSLTSLMVLRIRFSKLLDDWYAPFVVYWSYLVVLNHSAASASSVEGVAGASSNT